MRPVLTDVLRQREWDSLRLAVMLHARTFSSPETESRLTVSAGP
jgi:hypothetical protein